MSEAASAPKPLRANPPRAKVAVLISGSGTNMAALYYASQLPDAAYEIVVVGSNNPNAAGLKFAEAVGIATFAISHKGMGREAHDRAINSALKESGAEFVALAGYMRILGADFVRDWDGHMVNIHPSLLPKYKGLDTHKRALEAGDREAGCTVHLVSAELDDGPLLGQLQVPIMDGDTHETLAARVLIAEHQLYPNALSSYVRRPYDADYIREKLDHLAMSLPDATRGDSMGFVTWRAGQAKSAKIFAHFLDHFYGEPYIAVAVKCPSPDEMASLIAREPRHYFKPAYYGASGWIGLILNRRDVDWDHVGKWLERSYREVAPKRLVEKLPAAEK